MSKDPLNEIMSRLEGLEKAVFSSGAKRRPHNPKVLSGEGLPAHILTLKDQDFFTEPRTAGEVKGKLKSKYPCEHDRVAMALLRLQRRRQLRKTSKMVDKKKQVAYVW